MEGDAIVHGDMVVFDPQDAASPKALAANCPSAGWLALMCSRHEACMHALLTGLTSAQAEQNTAAFRRGAAHVVVIKQGPMGALVHDGCSAQWVPAYQPQSVWKLG